MDAEVAMMQIQNAIDNENNYLIDSEEYISPVDLISQLLNDTWIDGFQEGFREGQRDDR